jgi:heme exporter protein A
VLEAQQIECVRGSRRLFRNLSFRVEAGQALRVRGENGAGKTSLLRMVAGLSPAEAGRILWRGAPVRPATEDYRHSLAWLGHANGLKDDLTPLENLRHALAQADIGATDAALRDGLKEMGLAAAMDLPVRLLSQGQKRRAALARLQFSGDRPLWILDEPFAALDVAAAARLAATMRAHLDAGGLVLYTTHQEVDLPGTAVQSLELGAG